MLGRLKSAIKPIGSSTIVVAGFAAVSAVTLALTDLGTRDAIAENERQEVLRQLTAVMPPSSYDNDPLLDSVTVSNPLLDSEKPATIYRARRNGQLTGIAVEAVAPNGYSGPIRLLIGIDQHGGITGVRTITHKETAGLGDKIDEKKSDWILGFDGKSLSSPPESKWAVKKNGGVYDSFSGATITPRAVVQATANTLRYAKQHWQTLSVLPTNLPADNQTN